MSRTWKIKQKYRVLILPELTYSSKQTTQQWRGFTQNKDWILYYTTNKYFIILINICKLARSQELTMHTANEQMFLKFLWSNAQWWFIELKHIALMTSIKDLCVTTILHLYSTQQKAWIFQLVTHFFTFFPAKTNFYSKTLRTSGTFTLWCCEYAYNIWHA